MLATPTPENGREQGLGLELPPSPPIWFRKMDASILAKCKAAMKCSLCEPRKEKMGLVIILPSPWSSRSRFWFKCCPSLCLANNRSAPLLLMASLQDQLCSAVRFSKARADTQHILWLTAHDTGGLWHLRIIPATWPMSGLHNYTHIEGYMLQECDKAFGGLCPDCVIQTAVEKKGLDLVLKPSEFPLLPAISTLRSPTHMYAPAFSLSCPFTSLPSLSTP